LTTEFADADAANGDAVRRLGRIT